MRSLGCIAYCALALEACSGKPGTPPVPAPPNDPPAAAPVAVAAPVPPDFPDGTRSLKLVRTVPVRLGPADDAKRIGTIAIDTRVAWTRTTNGKGCKQRWVEIEPRGWVCGDSVEPSKKPAHGKEVPRLDRGEIVPGDYGKVTGAAALTYTLEKPSKKAARKPRTAPVTTPADLDAVTEQKMVEHEPIVGSLTVRIYEQLVVGGKSYVRISPKRKEYVLASAVSKHRPSAFQGARLGDDTGLAVPIAFVWPRGGSQQAWTHGKPNAIVRRQLSARTPVPILEIVTAKDGKPNAYRIGEAEWIPAADVRVFESAPPPPYLARGERWIDIDLDDQILVAYEGDLAVYATMVSSGAKATPTTTGLYRMWLKESEADMKNLKREDPYSVATVPWTQFFYPEEDLAIHTAYWHDGFGRTKSHGCVNLAPRDARWLYYWSEPQVPPGWTMTAGVVEMPGSVVRVRSAADPTPAWKGYAKTIVEARQRNAPVK